MRSTIAAGLFVFSVALVSPGEVSAETRAIGHEVTGAARELRNSLPDEQREKVSYGFDDPERFDLRLAPFLLEGLEMADMDGVSKVRLGALLEASLGPVGRRKADEIRNLEAEVIRTEPWYAAPFTGLLGIRGAEGYFLSLYGNPSEGGTWGYRFDGHHLSVNVTSVGGAISATPLFFGAQPREIPEGGVGGPVGLRVLGEEEDRARELYDSLDSSQRQKATLALELGRGLFVGAGERVPPDLAPAGIAASDLRPEQRVLLARLLEAYFQNVAEPVAESERARLEEAGPGAVHFAWAGSTRPGAKIYYRIHGPTVLIEFDNTEDDAEHIHALWRDPSGDFGQNLLLQHYESAHDPDSH